MIVSGQIERALDNCYEAVIQPERWQNALDGLAGAFGARCCSFHARHAGSGRLQFPYSSQYGDFLEEFLRDGWWARDHRAGRGWPLIDAGRQVLVDHDIASDADRRSMPEYRELYARHDLPWWGAVVFYVEGRQWCMPFLRNSRQGAFVDGERQAFLSLQPHLTRMVSLAGQYATVTARHVLDVLEQLATPAMLLDWQGRVFASNTKAEALLDRAFGLAAGRFRVAHRPSALRLEEAIRRVLATHAVPNAGAETVAIEREGRRPLVVDLIRCRRSMFDVLPGGVVLVVFTDLQAIRVSAAGRLRHVFRLSATEARVATVIARGGGVDSAAAELAVSRETLRSHLKAVMAKTGTGRQAELAMLVMALSNLA